MENFLLEKINDISLNNNDTICVKQIVIYNKFVYISLPGHQVKTSYIFLLQNLHYIHNTEDFNSLLNYHIYVYVYILLIICIIVLIVFPLIIWRSRRSALKHLLMKNKQIIELEKNKTIKQSDIKNTDVPQENTDIYNKFIELLKSDSAYLNKDLSLSFFANKININLTKLSTIINSLDSRGYSEIVNEYRVNHAQRLLHSPEYNKYNILGFSELSGFRSVTTFNFTFKKHTGLTPSFYKKNIK